MSSLSTSSLFGPPTKSLVAPGQCQFTDSFEAVKLLQKWKVSHTSTIFRFETPDTTKPLNLSTCACILAKGSIATASEESKEDVIRPYTPISTNALVGSFDLLVKEYPNGKLSKHMSNMELGETLEFKHIPFNVKTQAPFPYKQIGMIVGGTGITPMVQALHAILGDEKNSIKVKMLYGSRESSDILGVELLDVWKCDSFEVTHVLSHEPESSDWKGKRGFITKDLIEEFLPAPTDEDICIFICGPPPLYNALSGPRDEKEVKGVLKEMGYNSEQVYKF